MERHLDEKMDDIMSKPGVVGAVCVDKRGLTLSAKGVAPRNMGGILSSLAEQARKLDPVFVPQSGTVAPAPTVSPIIRLESEQGYCLVQKKGDVTLGIFKNN